MKSVSGIKIPYRGAVLMLIGVTFLNWLWKCDCCHDDIPVEQQAKMSAHTILYLAFNSTAITNEYFLSGMEMDHKRTNKWRMKYFS
jgi:hypothetical protein